MRGRGHRLVPAARRAVTRSWSSRTTLGARCDREGELPRLSRTRAWWPLKPSVGHGPPARAVSGKVALRDYDFEKPAARPEASTPQADAGGARAVPVPRRLHGPCGRPRAREGPAARRRAQRHVVLIAMTTLPAARAGARRVALGPDPRRSERALAPYRSASGSDPTTTSASRGEATLRGAASSPSRPSGVPARPPHGARTVGGVQTATVTGPPGREIHPDAFGRVKVQLRWDRRPARDDKASHLRARGTAPDLGRLPPAARRVGGARGASPGASADAPISCSAGSRTARRRRPAPCLRTRS